MSHFAIAPKGGVLLREPSSLIPPLKRAPRKGVVPERNPDVVVPYKNFYDVIPKSILSSIPRIHYENESVINMRLPNGVILVGSTGSGKTNWLLHFLSLVDSFDRVTIYALNTVEPLYAFLIRSLSDAGIQCDVFNDLENVIPPDEYDATKNNVVIIDDMMNAPKRSLEPIENFFTLGRKKNITPIWICQSFFHGTPQTIRLNVNYIVIFKLNSRGDARRICADSALNKEPEELVEILSYIQSKGRGQFMMIDKVTTDPSLKV